MRARLAPLLLVTGCWKLDPDLVPTLNGDWCDDPRTERVACVWDGDTFDVGQCGEDLGERIRLLGVAAPEIAHPPEPAQCYGDEAWAFMEDVVADRDVRLEFDLECTGIYGRTLAWVFIEADADDPLVDILHDYDDLGIQDDGSVDVLLNELMVRAGFATLYDESWAKVDDLRYARRMEEAEANAETEQLGLWTACDE